MYQTKRNESRMTLRIIFSMLILFVSSIILTAGTNGNGQQESVESIYESIRYAGARYEWDESIVTFENEGMTVVCSLTIPNTGHKAPIIIHLNGFNGDRNDLLIPGTDEPIWKRVSRMMAEQGLASLRVDFRGSGDSDGEYSMTTFSSQISDTLAAVNYIRTNLKHLVDANSIGIQGFSQGGLVAGATAALEKDVDALVLWSPVTNAPKCYMGLLTEEGVRQGLAMEDGGAGIFGIYFNGEYANWDANLGKRFFEELFEIDPLVEISKYDGPIMVVVGKNDPVIWPQPAMGNLYMKYHKGEEHLVVLDGDHAFNWWEGPNPQILHDAIYWGAAWFIKTLKAKY